MNIRYDSETSVWKVMFEEGDKRDCYICHKPIESRGWLAKGFNVGERWLTCRENTIKTDENGKQTVLNDHIRPGTEEPLSEIPKIMDKKRVRVCLPFEVA